MIRLCLVALLAIGAVSVAAQPPSPAAAIQPSVDSAAQRQALRSLLACLAQVRPRWARRTLSHPYLSEAQARDAADALEGNDNCVQGSQAEVTFRTSSLVGSLAELFVRADLPRTDPARLARTLATLTPLNVSEDFALCMAATNPAAARDLALSEIGSDAETQAAQRLAAHVAPCTNQGEQLTVDLQSLRTLMSVALYRGVTTILRDSD